MVYEEQLRQIEEARQQLQSQRERLLQQQQLLKNPNKLRRGGFGYMLAPKGKPERLKALQQIQSGYQQLSQYEETELNPAEQRIRDAIARYQQAQAEYEKARQAQEGERSAISSYVRGGGKSPRAKYVEQYKGFEKLARDYGVEFKEGLPIGKLRDLIGEKINESVVNLGKEQGYVYYPTDKEGNPIKSRPYLSVADLKANEPNIPSEQIQKYTGASVGKAIQFPVSPQQTGPGITGVVRTNEPQMTVTIKEYTPEYLPGIQVVDYGTEPLPVIETPSSKLPTSSMYGTPPSYEELSLALGGTPSPDLARLQGNALYDYLASITKPVPVGKPAGPPEISLQTGIQRGTELAMNLPSFQIANFIVGNLGGGAISLNTGIQRTTELAQNLPNIKFAEFYSPYVAPYAEKVVEFVEPKLEQYMFIPSVVGSSIKTNIDTFVTKYPEQIVKVAEQIPIIKQTGRAQEVPLILSELAGFIPTTPKEVLKTGAIIAAGAYLGAYVPEILTIADIGIGGYGVYQVATATTPEEEAAGITNIGLSATGFAYTGYKSAREPVVFYEEIPITKRTTTAKEITAISGENLIGSGAQIDLTATTPPRYGFVTTKGQEFFRKLFGFTPESFGKKEIEELTFEELSILYPKGKLVEVAPPRVTEVKLPFSPIKDKELRSLILTEPYIPARDIAKIDLSILDETAKPKIEPLKVNFAGFNINVGELEEAEIFLGAKELPKKSSIFFGYTQDSTLLKLTKESKLDFETQKNLEVIQEILKGETKFIKPTAAGGIEVTTPYKVQKTYFPETEFATGEVLTYDVAEIYSGGKVKYKVSEEKINLEYPEIKDIFNPEGIPGKLGIYFPETKEIYVKRPKTLKEKIERVLSSQPSVKKVIEHEKNHYLIDELGIMEKLDEKQYASLFKKAKVHLEKLYGSKIPYPKSQYVNEYLADNLRDVYSVTSIPELIPPGRRARMGKLAEVEKSVAKAEFTSQEYGIKEYEQFIQKFSAVETTYPRFRKPLKTQEITGIDERYLIELPEETTPTKILMGQRRELTPEELAARQESLVKQAQAIKESQKETRKAVIRAQVAAALQVKTPRTKSYSQVVKQLGFVNMPTVSVSQFAGLGLYERTFGGLLPGELPGEQGKEITQEIPQEIPKEIPKEIPREIDREITREINREINREIPKEIPREVLRETLREVPREIVRDITREVPRETVRQPPPTLVTVTPRNTTKLKKSKSKDLSKKNLMRRAAYRVYLKRRGAFVPIGRGLPRGRALKLGSESVQKELSRQFKIVKQGTTFGEDIAFKPKEKYFRGYQQRRGKRVQTPDQFIQRTSNALSSMAEKLAIQSARRTR